ncbi:General secretion pathway M protein [Oceanococcus atlanticus]|uniref:Type II secretion system protein M n=1 Tax=Oceanococcus atlanticus TaxID=1317117 RepID=A0A1Y1SCF9_9GAMM|nr:type II secretion system protein M [Oceanococcus atlanticus]ORE86243.1 General secretion pathway M protein [Oceanococcus atlanticus]RZO85956.1 MAG: type II secretion system protein M [Oceanococcus sp.]
MREWFDNLAPRERWIVSAGGVVFALMMYFLLVWDPLSQKAARLHNDLADARDLVSFMQSTRQQVAQLGGQNAGAPQSSGRSLLSDVDSSSKRNGLGDKIKRIQPEGQTSVRVWIEGVPFEQLLRWMDQLQNQLGIVLSDGSLDRDDIAGTVKARLTLVRGGA